jgi:hypothetical protein
MYVINWHTLYVAIVAHTVCLAFVFENFPPHKSVQLLSLDRTEESVLQYRFMMNESQDASSCISGDNHKKNEQVYLRCIDLLKSKGIKVVAFDMDQTAVSMHSRGRLRRGDPLDDFLGKVSNDFRNLVPLLHEHGFGLSIATHSDEAEFGGLIKPETHILGSELASALIQRYFTSELVNTFFIVAYNPRARKDGNQEDNKLKRYHVRKLLQHFQVQPQEIVFFDDTPTVVNDCNRCGLNAILVDANEGFQASDLLNSM